MAHRETPERVVSSRLSNQIKSDMQSSSQLFPVALISAERRGDLVEDVYRLKPANSPDASVELAVTRLGRVDQPDVRGTPVILLHGSFPTGGSGIRPRASVWARIWRGPAMTCGFLKCAAMACRLAT